MSNFSDFFPAAGSGGGGGYKNVVKYTTSTTVNPATELGIEDGGTIGYFMIGGGYNGATDSYGGSGGRGGNFLSGTVSITTASTNLTLVIGASNGGNTTLTVNGTTLTTANGGYTGAGGDNHVRSGNESVMAGATNGINGYGHGGASASNFGGQAQGPSGGDGWGHGGAAGGTGGTGAILIYY